jgi:hypothetical protein
MLPLPPRLARVPPLPLRSLLFSYVSFLTFTYMLITRKVIILSTLSILSVFPLEPRTSSPPARPALRTRPSGPGPPDPALRTLSPGPPPLIFYLSLLTSSYLLKREK